MDLSEETPRELTLQSPSAKQDVRGELLKTGRIQLSWENAATCRKMQQHVRTLKHHSCLGQALPAPWPLWASRYSATWAGARNKCRRSEAASPDAHASPTPRQVERHIHVLTQPIAKHGHRFRHRLRQM